MYIYMRINFQVQYKSKDTHPIYRALENHVNYDGLSRTSSSFESGVHKGEGNVLPFKSVGFFKLMSLRFLTSHCTFTWC